MNPTPQNEDFELDKKVYEVLGWDNTVDKPAQLKVWMRRYSLSEMGMGNPEYERTPAKERNKVHIYDWHVTDDPRHRMAIPEVVFKWWYHEVKKLEDEVVPHYDLEYVLDKLPRTVIIANIEYALEMWPMRQPRYRFSYIYYQERFAPGLAGEFADTPRNTALKLALALNTAGVLKRE